MGYRIQVSFTSLKADDWAALGAVGATLCQEGEPSPVCVTATAPSGECTELVDRSTWPSGQPQRLKAFYQKAGYKEGVAQARLDSVQRDPDGVSRYCYSCPMLCIVSPPFRGE